MKQTLFQTFAVPLVLAIATLAALTIGLVFEDWRDWIAIAGLAVPILIAGYHVTRRKGRAE